MVLSQLDNYFDIYSIAIKNQISASFFFIFIKFPVSILSLKRYDNRVSEYDFENPVSSPLARVVWRDFTHIGCGIAKSSDGKTFVMVTIYALGVFGRPISLNVGALISASPTSVTFSNVEDLPADSNKSKIFLMKLFIFNSRIENIKRNSMKNIDFQYKKKPKIIKSS